MSNSFLILSQSHHHQDPCYAFSSLYWQGFSQEINTRLSSTICSLDTILGENKWLPLVFDTLLHATIHFSTVRLDVPCLYSRASPPLSCLLSSWVFHGHRQRISELARQRIKSRGTKNVFLSFSYRLVYPAHINTLKKKKILLGFQILTS